MPELFAAMGKHRAEAIAELLASRTYERVLDIGAGGLMEWYGCDDRVTRLDVNPHANVEVHGAVEALPLRSASFDLVIATELIEHVRYPLRMLQEVGRVLNEEGELLVSTPNPSHLESRLAMLLLGYFLPDRHDHGDGDVGHIHFLDPNFLRRLLRQSGFRVMRDLSGILHLGSTVWTRVPGWVPRSLCTQTVYLARKAIQGGG